MTPDVGQLTDDGRRALEAARWDEAFESVLGAEETPDALAGLGLALWFLGEVTAGVAARERAVEAYVRTGRCDEAALSRNTSGRPSTVRDSIGNSARTRFATASISSMSLTG